MTFLLFRSARGIARRSAHHGLTTVALVGCLATQADPIKAAAITQWNFNTTVGANNSPAPFAGSGTASIIGMNGGPTGDILLADAGSKSASEFSTDPTGTTTTGDAWRVRGATANGYSTSNLTSGAQFMVPTVGEENITVSMDVYSTGGAPRFAQFEYTLDGSNFLLLGDPTDLRLGNTIVTGSKYPEGWQNGLMFNLTTIAGAANNVNFGIRIVTAFSPSAFTDTNGVNHGANTAFQRADEDPALAYDPGKGNLRLDMVTFSATAIATPEPSSIVMAGLGLIGMGLLHARRRRAAR